MTNLLLGDCLEQMKQMPDGSVNCCVTSPPYFGLRDYGMDGQIGLEETPDAYVARLVEVFREARRVLRDDGTLWLNLGDSYCGSGGAGNQFKSGGIAAQGVQAPSTWKEFASKVVTQRIEGLKPKDLIGIPWRVAFALQADGWYLRQDIIWHKPNPMPESVKDRCTKAHEYIFLLSKSQKYHFDADAIKEPLAEASIGRAERKQRLMDRTGTGTLGKQIENGVDSSHAYAGLALGRNGKTGYDLESGTRNRRSVWTVATKPFKGAHFATYPPELIRPCIQAGCPPQGTVLDPFGGSGTTAVVAIQEGRNAILCELNPEYLTIAQSRIQSATQAKQAAQATPEPEAQLDFFTQQK
jgi:DNA modification methylase